MNMTPRKPQNDLLKPRDPDYSDGLGDWGPQFPFYQGSKASDYIDQGRLVREVITEGFGKNISYVRVLVDPPPNGLLVFSADSALQQIPRNFYTGSPTDITAGFYTKNTRLRVIKPDYTSMTVTRYTFRLVPASQAFSTEYNPRLVQAFNDLVEIVNEYIPFDSPNLDDLGIWVLTVKESTILKPVDPNQKGALDGIDLSGEGLAASGGQNLLPWIISGAGLLTGSPLLIGSGFLLRFWESRQK